jgi:hypothetical protein
MLLEAFAAVHGLALGGLERDLALLAAVRTDGLMHLAGASVVASPSLAQLFHSYSVGIHSGPYAFMHPFNRLTRCLLKVTYENL